MIQINTASLKAGFIVLLMMPGVGASAQHKLMGMYWTAQTTPMAASLDPVTKVFTDLDTLKGVFGIAGGDCTYDPVHGVYYGSVDMAGDMAILRIDGVSGRTLDTLINPRNSYLTCLEYDMNADRLIGLRWRGSTLTCATMNIHNGVVTDLDTIKGTPGIMPGETAFDPYNNRYFATTDPWGILAIDAANGHITDTIPYRFMNIAYDPMSHKLMGVRFKGRHVVFSTMDIVTKTLSDLDTLAGATGVVGGDSPFDPDSGRYYVGTDIGLFVINAATGATIDTIAMYPGFMDLQLTYRLKMLSFSTQPQDQAVPKGATVQFSMSTTAVSPRYQWQASTNAGLQNISDGGQYSGTSGPVLTLSNAGIADDNRKFRCMITADGRTNPSRIAGLKILMPAAVSEVAGIRPYTVFSNPETGLVLVKQDADAAGTAYTICNEAGMVVIKGVLGGRVTTIDCSRLATGVYVLDINGGYRFKVGRW